MGSRSPALKRLGKEWKEISTDDCPDYKAFPVEGNLFEWHFIIRGPTETPFEGGVYHGRISLPPDYPFKPPTVIFTTPSGRFQPHTKICLSITGFHPEYWQPAWGIRTAIMGLMSMLPVKDAGSLGSIVCTEEEIKQFAKLSRTWACEVCRKEGVCMPPQSKPEKPKQQVPSPTTPLPSSSPSTIITPTTTPTTTPGATPSSLSLDNLPAAPTTTTITTTSSSSEKKHTQTGRSDSGLVRLVLVALVLLLISVGLAVLAPQT